MASLTESIPFAPSGIVLERILEELDDVGTAGGGAVGPRERRDAFERFATFGPDRTKRPSTWRHDEANLSFEGLRWSSGRIRVPAPPLRAPSRPQAQAGDAPALAVENAGGLVHAGSIYLEATQRLGDARVTLISLADALRAMRERVQSVAHRIAPPDADRFTALATAFQNCGAYVEVPDGVVLDAPLQLVWSARPGEAAAVFPHTVVRVGAGARATIVERHVGEGESFVAGLVEVDMLPGAQLDYVVVQQADEGARIFMRRAARCAEGAKIGWHVADFGGALVRSHTAALLRAPQAQAQIETLFFVHGFGQVEHEVEIAHRASRSHSETLARTAATEHGHGRFAGSVQIAPATQGCDATLRDDALVLSRNAYIEAVPVLQIETDELSASHAATVGSLDEEMLYYVQSRGISRRRAERMVALAFFEPAIARFPGEALRDEVRTALDERLEGIPETFSA